MAINLLTTLKSPDTKPLAEGTVTGLKLHPLGRGRASWMLWYQSPARSKDAAPRKMKLGEAYLSSDSKRAEGMSVKEAQAAAHAQRKLIENKIDPMDQRDQLDATLAKQETQEKQADRELREFNEENARRAKLKLAPLPRKHTFDWVAAAWIEYKRKTCSANYCYHLGIHLKWASEVFGAVPVNEVTDDHVAECYRRIMAAGSYTVLDAVKSACRAIFAWARLAENGKLRTTGCPMFDSDSHKPKTVRPKSHAAATKPDDIRTLMLALHNAPTGTERKAFGFMPKNMSPVKALIFKALTAQRSMTVSTARFDEMHDLDGAHPKWIIPAEKMKAERWEKEAGLIEDHVVYLSRQAVALVRAQRAAHPYSSNLFPMRGGSSTPIGRTAMAQRLRDLGFSVDKDKNTRGVAVRPHGMRAMLRTAAQRQLGYKDDKALVLEMVLAHRAAKELSNDDLARLEHAMTGGLGTTYLHADVEGTRALYEAQAHKIMQGWADYLDQLVDPASVAGLIEQPRPEEQPAILAA